MIRWTGIRQHVALAALCAALAGCGVESPAEPRGESTVISPDVFVVDERTGLSLVEAGDSVLVLDALGTMPKIRSGSIVVGTDGGGYIRRARSVVVKGKRIFIGTLPGVLADAVVTGVLDARASIGFSGAAAAGRGGFDRCVLVEAAPGVSLSGDGLDLSNLVLFSGDSGGVASSASIGSGRVEFAPAIDLSLRIIPGKLHRFRAGAEGDLRLGCDARFEASGPVRKSGIVPVASVRKAVVLSIGPVPVVEVVTMSISARFDVSSDSAFSGEVGIDLAGHVRGGMSLESGVWSSSFDLSPAFAPRPFLYDGRKGARLELAIEPRVSVEFFGVPSVDLAFRPSFGLAEADEGLPVLAWELFASHAAVASFDPGALDRRTPSYDGERLRCCRVTLASGPFRTDDYVYVGQWNIEAEGGAPAYPRGIALDGRGDVYVTDAWNGDVQKYTSDGAFLLRWGGAGIGDGQFDSPEKIAIDEDGFVYVADGGNNRVQKFSPDGTFILKWGSEGTGEGEFLAPAGVAASDGVVFVTDGRNNRVQKFSTSGEFLGAWGGYGAGPGQFNGPMGIAVSPLDGSVLVADCQNHRIQRFSRDGEPLSEWGSYGTGDGQFDCAIDVTAAAGAVFAADLGNDRFMRFSPDGTFETKLGTSGTAEGQFDHPEAVAVGAHGDVYVVDARNSRVQRFAPIAPEARIRLNR
jgi:DNA-binding beta-propeller fold protein YncE